MNWRPIKSAPKDGTHILLCYPSFCSDMPPVVGQGRWTDEPHDNLIHIKIKAGEMPPQPPWDAHWETAYVARLQVTGPGPISGQPFNGFTFEARSCRVNPTHWMPLPDPVKSRS